MSAALVLIAAPDGRWWMRSADGALAELPVDDEGMPVLPEGAEVVRVWLPVEWLAVVPLLLPRIRPEALEEGVVAEEAEDRLGVDGARWRWCWHGHLEDERFAGLALGIEDERFARLAARGLARALGADALAVLAAARPDGAPQGVVAEDPEGIWAGFWDGRAWRGCLRLACPPGARRWPEARRALAGMGWTEEMPVAGRVGEGAPDWIRRHGDAFASRAGAVAAGANTEPAPGWRQAPAQAGRRWRLAAALVLLAGLSFVAERAWEVHVLRTRAALYEETITKAFRAALPDAPLVDPLLQLRRAAGAESVRTSRVLAMLAAVARARGEARIDTFDFRAGEGALLAGSVKDLEALAALRARLAKAWPAGVALVDSETRSGEVRFRLRLKGERR